MAIQIFDNKTQTEEGRNNIAKLISRIATNADSPGLPYLNGNYYVLDDCNDWFLRFDVHNPRLFEIWCRYTSPEYKEIVSHLNAYIAFRVEGRIVETEVQVF